MLVELKDVKQNDDEDFRRWFADDYFDLIVWYDRNKNISGFQLCYNKEEDERSLTWKKNIGFSHNKIDDGDRPGQAKMTPVLVPDGTFAKHPVADKFKEKSKEIDSDTADFVYKTILLYPGK